MKKIILLGLVFISHISIAQVNNRSISVTFLGLSQVDMLPLGNSFLGRDDELRIDVIGIQIRDTLNNGMLRYGGQVDWRNYSDAGILLIKPCDACNNFGGNYFGAGLNIGYGKPLKKNWSYFIDLTYRYDAFIKESDSEIRRYSHYLGLNPGFSFSHPLFNNLSLTYELSTGIGLVNRKQFYTSTDGWAFQPQLKLLFSKNH